MKDGTRVCVDSDYSVFEERWSHDRDENVVFALVRDCHSLYVYWTVTDEFIRQIALHEGSTWGTVQLALCLYDVTELQFDGCNAHHSQIIPVCHGADNWYVYDVPDGRNYVIDFGIRSASGFVPLLRSNCVRTPAAQVPASESKPAVCFTEPTSQACPSWTQRFTGYSVVESAAT